MSRKGEISVKYRSTIDRSHVGYLFILPFFIIFLVFHLYPIVYSLYLSFTQYDGFNPPAFIGLKQYSRLVADAYFWQALGNTLRIWLPNILLQLALALYFAVVFTNRRPKVRGVKFFRAVFYFPNLVTMASIALLFSVILDWQHGALNQMLFGENKDIYINWLAHPPRAQMIVALLQTWIWFGYTLIILMAGIQGIPQSYYEAAVVEGAGNNTIFWRITLPLLRPIMGFVVITSIIGGLQIFDVPYVITAGSGGRGRSLVTAMVFMYRRAFDLTQFGYGAAVSWMLFMITVVASLVYLKLAGIRAEGGGR